MAKETKIKMPIFNFFVHIGGRSELFSSGSSSKKVLGNEKFICSLVNSYLLPVP